MSKKYPECPLYNHNNCKQLHNPEICAIIRIDNRCLRDRPKSRKKSKESTGRAGGFEVLANPKGGAPIGGFTIQNLIALLDAL